MIYIASKGRQFYPFSDEETAVRFVEEWFKATFPNMIFSSFGQARVDTTLYISAVGEEWKIEPVALNPHIKAHTNSAKEG